MSVKMLYKKLTSSTLSTSSNANTADFLLTIFCTILNKSSVFLFWVNLYPSCSHSSAKILYVELFCQQLTYRTAMSGALTSGFSSKSFKTSFTAAVFPIPGAPEIIQLRPFLPWSKGVMQLAMNLCCDSRYGRFFGSHSGSSASSFLNRCSPLFVMSLNPIKRKFAALTFNKIVVLRPTNTPFIVALAHKACRSNRSPALVPCTSGRIICVVVVMSPECALALIPRAPVRQKCRPLLQSQ